jgi:hypothetical protein
LYGTSFGNTSLIDVKNLESCRHSGPSYIDYRTLARSWPLPREFLVGCGLPDWEIIAAELNDPGLSNIRIAEITDQVYQSRASNPIQIASLFVSYSHADMEFVDKIGEVFKQDEVRYWRDIHNAPAGPLDKIVVREIEKSGAVLLVLSSNSVNSDWVEFEAKKAREEEQRSGRYVLCPVTLDDAWQTCNWSGVLRNQIEKYHIMDFSNWNDDEELKKKMKRLYDGLELFYKEKSD